MKPDKEKARKNLKVILDKVHTGSDLQLLSEYRKLYKKEISLFRRSWTAAWLFMYYDQRELPNLTSSVEKKSFKKENADSAYAESKLVESTQVESTPVEVNFSEEESKRLFFSIGKNRHLFPREVIMFICSKTTVPREDIGSIRILDNYSFVQVRDTRANEIIEALNGLRFRGRTLTVNYAKQKNADSGNQQ